jgi:hypothetical protein
MKDLLNDPVLSEKVDSMREGVLKELNGGILIERE